MYFKFGDRVSIVNGPLQGKVGTVEGDLRCEYYACLYGVRLDDYQDDVVYETESNLKLASVEIKE